MPTRTVAGQVTRTAWKIEAGSEGSEQIMDGLTVQLQDAGWNVDFACADDPCGGYDFRFASNTLPAPEMYVDLGDYRYLLASHQERGVLFADGQSRTGCCLGADDRSVTRRRVAIAYHSTEQSIGRARRKSVDANTA